MLRWRQMNSAVQKILISKEEYKMKPSLHYLSEENICTIHEKALELLEQMGMKMELAEAREYLQKAGATVTGDIVKIPRSVIMKALETVPKRDDFILYAADPRYDIRLKDEAPVLAAMPAATAIIDLETREKRDPVCRDVAMLTRLQDRLGVGMVSGLVYPRDVQMDISDWYVWAETFKNTKKHINGSAVGKQGVRDIVEMAEIAMDHQYKFEDRPCTSVCVLTTPAMRIGRDALEVLIEASEQNMPMSISSGGIMGLTCPMTIESSAILAHAEVPAVTALSQLVRPGVQVLYTSFARSIDMRTMQVQMSSPETIILKSIASELGHYLNLPTLMAIALRDAKKLDAQAGFETGMAGVVGAMTADIFYGIQLDDDLVVDYADLPFIDDCMQQLRRLTRGLEFSEERMDVENIMEIGYGGNYLESPHTLEYFRSEVWQSELKEYGTWERWMEAGGKTMEEKCIERAKQLVEELESATYVTESQAEKIDAIVTGAKDKAKGVSR